MYAVPQAGGFLPSPAAFHPPVLVTALLTILPIRLILPLPLPTLRSRRPALEPGVRAAQSLSGHRTRVACSLAPTALLPLCWADTARQPGRSVQAADVGVLHAQPMTPRQKNVNVATAYHPVHPQA